MLIGQELDHEAAREQLESCLLTAKEMACGEESWLALADPWKAAKQGGVDGVHYPHDEHGPLSGVTEASLREMMKRASKQASAPPSAVNTESLDYTCTRDPLPSPPCVQGMPTDYLLGDVFEMFFDHDAADQIRACAPALRELLDGSEDTRRARQAILEGVVSLVTSPMLKKASCLVAEAMGAAPKHGEAMLKKTPAILMAL